MPQRVALLLSALSIGGCADVERQWVRAHEDRLATFEGLCRSHGFVSGSSKFVRCIQMKAEDRSGEDQTESAAAVEVARADGTTYSRQPNNADPPRIGVACGTMPDGQYSCVDR